MNVLRSPPKPSESIIVNTEREYEQPDEFEVDDDAYDDVDDDVDVND